ncbi:cytochrome P450 [Haloactinomyces albus]|uniref:Cytochrome P450 n=1 Tax=Haloactinomyces albus TaxID=1352928 RepID=A0AAE3Z7T3_9ACTN|nr:cytochrome P450 [Haloactinomyces albus]MDR7299898.1 cytochrome P450 [Haloactinomyces albus]
MTAPVDWFELTLQHDSEDQDHHTLLARKRRDSPVERLAPFGPDGPEVGMVYGYDQAAAVLADTGRFSLDVVEQRYRTVLGSSFLTAAPRARRALRRVLRERLHPGEPEVARLAGQVAEARVDTLRTTHGPVDVVEPLAAQIPARVMVRLLGLPEQQWRSVAELSAATAGFLRDPRGAVRAARTLRHRFRAALRDRHTEVGDDLMSVLACTDVDGRRLDDAELTSSLLLLAWAGTETAGPAIANCLYALLTHPEEAEAVRTGAELLPAAVDEALRWETPVQLTARRVESGTEIAGVWLPEGTTVLAHLGAANRDPRRFDHPDTYAPGRADAGQLAFGHGPHHCLGAALARTEIAGCLRVLLERFPNVRLAPQAPVPQGRVVRCPRELPVWLH